MKTEDLVERLTRDARPVAAGADGRWLGAGLATGTLASAAVLAGWLGLAPNAAVVPSWLKAGYGMALAGSGWLLASRLSRPAGLVGRGGWLGLAGLVVLFVIGGQQLSGTESAGYQRLVFGATWATCPAKILALALPILAALLASMRHLAPTRAATAGAAAGLLAGGVAAALYSLHCREASAVFVAVWYSAGVALSVILGAAAGPRVLRW